jgi:hypothetical protein
MDIEEIEQKLRSAWISGDTLNEGWSGMARTVQSMLDAAVAAAKAPEPAASLDELADRLRRAWYSRTSPEPSPFNTLDFGPASDWHAVAAEAMKAAPPAPANDFTIPPLRSAYDRDGPMPPDDEQERRALRERVILAVYTKTGATLEGVARYEADWLISYINGG